MLISDMSPLPLSKGGTGVSNLDALKNLLGLAASSGTSGNGTLLTKVAYGTYDGDATDAKSFTVDFDIKLVLWFDSDIHVATSEGLNFPVYDQHVTIISGRSFSYDWGIGTMNLIWIAFG